MITHFHNEIVLPTECRLDKYNAEYSSGGKRGKIKHKFDRFSYYQCKEGICKILFLDDERYVEQGVYPFTDTLGKVHQFADLSPRICERLLINELAYIGHLGQQLVLKKLSEVTYDTTAEEIETKDDNFELLPIANHERFAQFLKIMANHPHPDTISIRVMVKERGKEGEEPTVIDYEFFGREIQLRQHLLTK